MHVGGGESEHFKLIYGNVNHYAFNLTFYGFSHTLSHFNFIDFNFIITFVLLQYSTVLYRSPTVCIFKVSLGETYRDLGACLGETHSCGARKKLKLK